jgi:hypothetical protein
VELFMSYCWNKPPPYASYSTCAVRHHAFADLTATKGQRVYGRLYGRARGGAGVRRGETS